ncbi:(2Fe-2S)-binding protein [Marivita geojedonensis]|uniref:Isoquinoline 1-oxidoreductase n=1 Tax=Marivita geojedonensis TaxID=1123756 RepID=A0A1X4NNU2_9RHOB|nr:(2Fe-2S)-binding protein [Marivita geojedonensis]OSQ52410.1 isoquinoline 1-oxidoreductase [Marivita geojedonensis]PRY73260.1 isoquinoline 1-oxidoreductase alpha subunit [Marivita geojedonensis]
MTISLKINGALKEVDPAPGTPLLWVLREELAMTGTKFGCGVAACGACTVHIDGVAERSCQALAEDLEGSEITTIEAIGSSPAGAAVQKAWTELDVVQCGYCQSGQIMSAVKLLNDIANPTDQDIDDYMDGNACRCATYVRIRAAIHRAADIMEG